MRESIARHSNASDTSRFDPNWGLGVVISHSRLLDRRKTRRGFRKEDVIVWISSPRRNSSRRTFITIIAKVIAKQRGGVRREPRLDWREKLPELLSFNRSRWEEKRNTFVSPFPPRLFIVTKITQGSVTWHGKGDENHSFRMYLHFFSYHIRITYEENSNGRDKAPTKFGLSIKKKKK